MPKHGEDSMGRPPIAQGFPDNMFDVGQRDIVDQLRCAVCLGVGRDIVSTPCGHVFCQECLGRWIGHKLEQYMSATCPVCRAVISKNPAACANQHLRNKVAQLRTVCVSCHWEGCMSQRHLHECPGSSTDTSYISELSQRAFSAYEVYKQNREKRVLHTNHTFSTPGIEGKCFICRNSLDEPCSLCRGFTSYCTHLPGLGGSFNCRYFHQFPKVPEAKLSPHLYFRFCPAPPLSECRRQSLNEQCRSCGQCYHVHCSERWYEHDKTCPVCEEFWNAPRRSHREGESLALITIFVRTPSKTVFKLRVGQMESITDVKHRIRDNFTPYIPVDRMGLIIDNDNADNCRFLQDYDIRLGSYVDLILYHPFAILPD
jgi:hypothetical protein